MEYCQFFLIFSSSLQVCLCQDLRQQEEERSRHMHTRQQAGWPEWPPQLPHLQQFRPALYQTGGQMGQARQTHQLHPAHHFAPAEVHQMGHAYPHGHPQAGHLPQAYAPGTASQTIHLTGHPMQTSAQDAHQRWAGWQCQRSRRVFMLLTAFDCLSSKVDKGFCRLAYIFLLWRQTGDFLSSTAGVHWCLCKFWANTHVMEWIQKGFLWHFDRSQACLWF